MKRVTIIVNQDRTVVINADRFEIIENFVKVFDGEKLVGLFDIGIVNAVYMSEQKGKQNDLQT